LTGQGNHLAATIGADIVKQKMAENNGGYKALKFGKTHPKVYSELTTDHPIDLVRYQVANCYMGRIGLINSGGAQLARLICKRRCARRDQQKGRRHGAYFRSKSLSASYGRRCGIIKCHSGRLSF